MERNQKKNLSVQEQFVQDMLKSASQTQEKTQPNKSSENPDEIANILDQLRKKSMNR